jgi:hypothetical protein
MSYAFGGILYRCEREYHDAIVDHWLWADGLNPRSDVVEWLAGDHRAIAQEILVTWGPFDDPPVTEDELVAACERLRDDYAQEDENQRRQDEQHKRELIAEQARLYALDQQANWRIYGWGTPTEQMSPEEFADLWLEGEAGDFCRNVEVSREDMREALIAAWK